MRPMVRQAQQWHDEHHGDRGPAWSFCWCHCLLCDPETGQEKSNPHYREAWASGQDTTRRLP